MKNVQMNMYTDFFYGFQAAHQLAVHLCALVNRLLDEHLLQTNDGYFVLEWR